MNESIREKAAREVTVSDDAITRGKIALTLTAIAGKTEYAETLRLTDSEAVDVVEALTEFLRDSNGFAGVISEAKETPKFDYDDGYNDAIVDAVAWARTCSGEGADVAADYIEEMGNQGAGRIPHAEAKETGDEELAAHECDQQMRDAKARGWYEGARDILTKAANDLGGMLADRGTLEGMLRQLEDAHPEYVLAVALAVPETKPLELDPFPFYCREGRDCRHSEKLAPSTVFAPRLGFEEDESKYPHFLAAVPSVGTETPEDAK